MVSWTFETEVDPQDFSAVFQDPMLSGIVTRFGGQADAFLSTGGGLPLPIQATPKVVTCNPPTPHPVSLTLTLTPDRQLYSAVLDTETPTADMTAMLDVLRYGEHPAGAVLGYYDTVAPKKPMYVHGGATDREIREKRILMSNSTVEFSRAPFQSNKLPANVFGDAPASVFDRVHFFLQRKAWYADKGVPYQLGILLSGLPGAGKSSTVKAIANCARRHVVNVDCKHLVRSDQFKALFFDDELFISGASPCRVPISERLIVLEEVDQMPCFLKRRFTARDEPLDNELSISDVLTTLDGAREAPGRMYVLTTNHPEVLDAAILRPGRIDVHARFENANKALIRSIYEGLLDADSSSLDLPDDVSGKLSPACIAQIILKKVYDPRTDVLAELLAAVGEASRARDDDDDGDDDDDDDAAADVLLPLPLGAQHPLNPMEAVPISTAVQ